MKFRLIAERTPIQDPGPKHRIEVEFDAEILDDVLEEFAMFLRGCGYFFDGQLLPVEFDEEPVERKPEEIQ